MNTATDLNAVFEQLQECKSSLNRIESQILSIQCPSEDISGRIKSAVCAEFRISILDMMRPGRLERFAWPRQTAMYFERELTTKSLMQIGEEYHKDHGTVMHAHRLVESRVQTQPKVRAQIEAIRDRITDNPRSMEKLNAAIQKGHQ